MLEDRKAVGRPIGRPHVAQAVVQHPANGERLASEGLGGVSEFLVAYLIDGKPAFVGRSKPTVAEAIETIHSAGGLAVWAHPFWDMEAAEEALGSIERYADLGLDGVEAFYVTHTEHQARLVAEPLRAARPPHDRVGGLPRSRPPPVQRVPRLRDVRVHTPARAHRRTSRQAVVDLAQALGDHHAGAKRSRTALNPASPAAESP